MKISQSFLKDYADYREGKTCGLQTKAKYIDGIKFFSSDVMELGNFFEFMATGSLPRDGHIPVADVVYKNKPNEKMSEPYERATKSAEYFKEIIEYYGIEILDTGVAITLDNGMTGIMDIVAKWGDRVVIIDTKYSGLLDDRWNDLGWEINSLPDKHKLMIQGVHYRILLSEKMNIPIEDIDFYFFLFSQQKPRDVRIIKQVIDELTIQRHLAVVESVKYDFETYPIESLLKAIPTLLRCGECTINSTCKHRATMPIIQEVLY